MNIKTYGIEVINNSPMVPSRVIAEQLNKNHNHVMAKIREVLTLSEYCQREYTYGNNNKATEYILNKDSFILLVMNYEGYNDFKRAYIKRFNELELQNASNIIEPPTQLQLAKQVVELLEQKELLLIKIQVVDELVSKDGLYLPSIAGKIITGHPNLFCKWLEDQKIMFRRGDRLLPMARFSDRYFKIKISTYKDKSREQSYFTIAGLAWIKAKYLKANNMLKLDYEEVKNG